jgi:hypothetical protein
MTATAKTVTVNYTVEQTTSMVANYAEGMTVADLATLLGKSTRSIIAKLSREGVYQKKEYKTKSGETVVKKDALADKMAEVFGLTEAEADSLTKANKTALKKILDKFENTVE